MIDSGFDSSVKSCEKKVCNDLKMDLHVHTVLSPCADLLMTPGNIVKKALEQQLDLIAITDHNSAQNVKIAMEIARKSGLKVIPGMEVETAEEVHILCLFKSLEQVLEWQEIVYGSLPDLKNDEDFFGPQLLTDINDKFIARVDRLLATASRMNITEVVEKVNKLGGIAIPAHIDRAYGLITNLGFLPADLEFPLLEVAKNSDVDKLKKQFPFLKDYFLIKNSDAHYLTDLESDSRLSLSREKFERRFSDLVSMA